MNCDQNVGCLIPMPCLTMSCLEFGDNDIGKAANICSRHETISGFVYSEGGRPHEWKAPWEACRRVWSAWQETEAAKARRDALAAEKRDLDFINNVADGLR